MLAGQYSVSISTDAKMAGQFSTVGKEKGGVSQNDRTLLYCISERFLLFNHITYLFIVAYNTKY